jgi:hypothetical protein
VRIRINGQTWKVVEAAIRDWGYCTPSERLIELRAGQRPQNRLDTLLHELLHAMRPSMSEREVRAIAGVLAKGLWADGWRRPQKE